MKKNYIAPEVALVSYATEHNVMLTGSINPGKEGETVDSNVRLDADWDEE